MGEMSLNHSFYFTKHVPNVITMKNNEVIQFFSHNLWNPLCVSHSEYNLMWIRPQISVQEPHVTCGQHIGECRPGEMSGI